MMAILNPRSPRYRDWKHILDCDEVHLISPLPHKAQLGQEVTEVHALDLGKLDQDQFERLVDWVQAKFGAPRQEIEAELRKTGFPIREEDVIVGFEWRHLM